MVSNLSLYNQNIQNDDDFVACFVARHDSLDTLLRRLRTAEPDDCGPHCILYGPRGMGKTSLLRRIAIAINRDRELAERFVPLTFREEQYNVLALCDFWRNCVEALAEWAEATGRNDLAKRLDAALMSSAWADDDTSLEQFSTELASLQRRAVLLIDNIDLILDALPVDSTWVLRRHLQARHGPIVIGAAIQPLKQSADRDAAFYEFFQPEYLAPLDEHETERCMRGLARGRSTDGARVIEVLDRQPERLKTLHTLTGGNPRVLTLIYRLLESGQSDAAMADLEILLDQVTPYYKARVEEYQTPQQRAVIDAIALNWDPITTSDLSRVTNVAMTTLSGLLIKLRKDGLMESVQMSASYAGHQFVERFFNIWYLMRHGTRRTKQKMRWLVAFLTRFYSSRELAEIACRANDAGYGMGLHADYVFAIEQALASQNLRDNAADRIPKRLRKLVQEITEAATKKNYTQCLAILNECLAVLNASAACFVDAHEPVLREALDRVFISKALIFALMGDNAAAVAAYDALLARFADAQEPALREQVARALVNKGVALGRMDDHAAAVAIFDDLLARFADAREPALREQVARALVYKADTLGRMGDNAAAIAILERLILFADDDTPPMLESLYAEARIRLADMLVEFQGGGVRAETLYREAASVMPVLANANLAWSYLSTNQIPSAVNLRESLGDLPPYGLALLDAAIEIAKDNFGSATDALTSALGGNLSSEDMDFSDDLLRLLRLAESRGYGDRLIAWLEASGNADRIAPIYVAFKAYVRRSEAILLDVNPEVRQPAKIIYERLDAPRRCGIDVSPKKKRARRKRG